MLAVLVDYFFSAFYWVIKFLRTAFMAFIAILAVFVLTGSDPAFGDDQVETALFAGGCFWCMEPPFDAVDGVVKTISGFAGGTVPNPSYKQVVAGGTGHFEVVQVHYNPSLVSYENLLEVYFANIDPVDEGGQFCDRGQSYMSAVFAKDAKQKRQITTAIRQLQTTYNISRVATKLLKDAPFYPAEDEHQDYYKNHAQKYKFYRWRCGRDDRLQELWGGHDKLMLF